MHSRLATRPARLSALRPAIAGLVSALALAAGTASAEGRWALVLGVADYASDAVPDLTNTVNDSRTMAAALNDMGFEVYYLEDAPRAEIAATVARIRAEQADADLGVFFFAGHGLQLDGVNYALPSDIVPQGADFLRDQGVSINALVAELGQTGADNLVVILDSCRNSPFPDQAATGTGLALVDAPANTIIAYSTAPGAVALDGAGANSPFTAALASALVGPEQDFRDILRLVRARVRVATGGAQTPWYIDNSRGEITIGPSPALTLDPALADATDGGIGLVATAWRTIAQSGDPRDVAAFVEQFPGTPLAEVASRQLAAVGDEAVPDFPLMDLGLPIAAPEVPGGLQTIVTQCDILATAPGDVMALSEGLPHDLVNTRAALRACVAAVADDPDNARLVGHLARVLRLEERFDEAFYYAEEAARMGNPSAWGALSEAYRFGLGVDRDLTRAAEAAKRGAMMGATPLRVLVGMHYREGWGVPQSFPEARRWFELAAQFGNSSGITALGDLFRRGQGMAADPIRALDQYRRAAALGHSDAMTNVGMAYMRGEGVEADPATGIRWLSEATDRGNPYSAFHLGRAFLTGWGVQPDRDVALAYFRLSAQRDFFGAYTFIGDILTDPASGDLRNVSEGYANYIIAREAASLRNTIASQRELEQLLPRLDALLPTMSPVERAAGERLAQEWIDQYGLLDFELVHE